ncbi:hypothetical protein TIFTF001_031824 [Ficus carica]|uniref:Uncharacterized protein n=1 Tax=Ficus carica TaxID=3494 RepID=A0AA88J4U2_FICCA|nr:hypothetical protein TIFTF001_031824 [Ficus carica]
MNSKRAVSGSVRSPSRRKIKKKVGNWGVGSTYAVGSVIKLSKFHQEASEFGENLGNHGTKLGPEMGLGTVNLGAENMESIETGRGAANSIVTNSEPAVTSLGMANQGTTNPRDLGGDRGSLCKYVDKCGE